MQATEWIRGTSRASAGQRGVGGGAGRAEDPGQPRLARRLRKSEHSADRPQPPVEGELPDGRVIGKAVARDLPRGGENREGDREIEARALLAEPGRREI